MGGSSTDDRDGSSDNRRVAKKTLFAGIQPERSRGGRRARPPHLVAVVAFDGVVLGDLTTPCEVFARVRDQQGRRPYDVRVCSQERRVTSSHLDLQVRSRLSILNRAHTVIVPGIDDLDREVPSELLRSLRRAVARGARVASICTGAFVLARTGALDKLSATTHWLVAGELARRHPAVAVTPDVLYVDNGQILTSAGAAAGLDLCLHLVRRDLGAAAAAQVARVAVMPLERAGGQAQFIVHDTPTAAHGSLGTLLSWIDQNLERDLSLPALARRAAMSSRTLSRRFREQVGTTPMRWVAAARVRWAQRLLETADLSVEDVAAKAGFGSAAMLREHFGEVVGTSPLAYRKAFRREAR
jgi:transcriptional regulator GlxA family with amidase domain